MSLDALPPTSAIAASIGARPGASSGAAQGAVPAVAASGGTGEDPPAADLESARKAANEALQKNGCELAFEFDDASGRVIARLIDTKTKEVLRQLPSRETLAIARALADYRSHGVLLETNA